MDNLEQQLRAGQDEIRRRMDWRPGREAGPMQGKIPSGQWSQHYDGAEIIARKSEVVGSADDIIYRMMDGGASADRE